MGGSKIDYYDGRDKEVVPAVFLFYAAKAKCGRQREVKNMLKPLRGVSMPPNGKTSAWQRGVELVLGNRGKILVDIEMVGIYTGWVARTEAAVFCRR